MPLPWRKILFGFAGLALAAPLWSPAAAYHHPLGSDQIRDAYFLGTDAKQSASFLIPYMRMFSPLRPSGPYVAQIEARTPYAQVVQNSLQRTTGYSAQQADDDYKKVGDSVQVRVQILYPLTGPLPLQPPSVCAGAQRMNDPLACFQGFRFRFTQGRQLQPSQTSGTALYSLSDSSLFDGGDLWFTFPAKQVVSAPLRVIVTDPQGRQVFATFDLAALL